MQKRKQNEGRSLSKALVLILLVLLIPAIAFAGGGSDPNHVPSIADTFKYWINFLVFFGVMGFILRNPFVGYWKQRAADIRAAVNAGEEAEKAAKERLEKARPGRMTLF